MRIALQSTGVHLAPPAVSKLDSIDAFDAVSDPQGKARLMAAGQLPETAGVSETTTSAKNFQTRK